MTFFLKGDFMGVKNFVLSAVLGLGLTQIMAMKRVADNEFVVDKNKRHKSICLFGPIINCDFKEFEKRVLHGANINQIKRKQPVFCYILSKVDKLRGESLNSALLIKRLEQQHQPYSIENNNDHDKTKKTHQHSIEKNSDAMRELYHCLKLLLDQKKFDINCVNRQGKPVVRALIFRNFDKIYSNSAEAVLKSMDETFVLRCFLEKGVFLGPDKEDGCTLLHYYTASEHDVLDTERKLKTVEMLIQYGIDIDCANPEGDTALHLCCNNMRMALLLLAFGAQFDKANKDGETARNITENPKVLAMIYDKEKVEKYKNDMREIIIKNMCFDANVHNVLQLTINNQRQQKSISMQNSFPYTRAVLEYTAVVEEMSEADYEPIEEGHSEFSEDSGVNLEESDED